MLIRLPTPSAIRCYSQHSVRPKRAQRSLAPPPSNFADRRCCSIQSPFHDYMQISRLGQGIVVFLQLMLRKMDNVVSLRWKSFDRGKTKGSGVCGRIPLIPLGNTEPVSIARTEPGDLPAPGGACRGRSTPVLGTRRSRAEIIGYQGWGATPRLRAVSGRERGERDRYQNGGPPPSRSEQAALLTTTG